QRVELFPRSNHSDVSAYKLFQLLAAPIAWRSAPCPHGEGSSFSKVGASVQAYAKQRPPDPPQQDLQRRTRAPAVLAGSTTPKNHALVWIICNALQPMPPSASPCLAGH